MVLWLPSWVDQRNLVRKRRGGVRAVDFEPLVSVALFAQAHVVEDAPEEQQFLAPSGAPFTAVPTAQVAAVPTKAP